MSNVAPFCLPLVFCGTKKVLCVGMGGGCDAITAYVLSQRLPGLSSNVAWGNTKRMTDGLKPISSGGRVWSVPEQVPLKPGENYYGTCGIDAAVPQGPHESPLVFKVPRIPKGATAEEMAAAEVELVALGGEIASLGFDAVVGVDAGGDSLTGGIDHCGDPSAGVDQMMLRALKYSKLPFLQVVCGLGCDGESTLEQLETVLLEERACGALMGTCSMTEWAPLFVEMAGVLGPTRTPAIIAAACSALSSSPAAPSDALMIVERGIRPSIPLQLLATAFVFGRTPM